MKQIIIIMGILSFFKFNLNAQSKPENTYVLPYFGEIDINKTKDVDGTIIAENFEIKIDLNFDEDYISKTQLKNIKVALENINHYLSIAKNILKEDFIKDGDVKDYFEHHKDYISDKNEFFNKLKVSRIGFYPDENNEYMILDFSIGKKVTNYIITISFNHNLEFDSIDFVS